MKQRLVELFPDGSTWEFYGSTEGQFTACRSEEWQARRGTVGRARPGRVLTVDDGGRIWCAVPQHARFTYLGDARADRRSWRDTPTGRRSPWVTSDGSIPTATSTSTAGAPT